jgi:hypothetical protein
MALVVIGFITAILFASLVILAGCRLASQTDQVLLNHAAQYATVRVTPDEHRDAARASKRLYLN